MILGIGTDIVEVGRLQSAVEKWGDQFLNRVFCPEEIEYSYRHKSPYPHLAGRFAAKEAILKAFGRNAGIAWKDMKILNDPDGKPCCVYQKPFDNEILISLSHTQHYAVANAIIQTRSEGA